MRTRPAGEPGQGLVNGEGSFLVSSTLDSQAQSLVLGEMRLETTEDWCHEIAHTWLSLQEMPDLLSVRQPELGARL